METVRPKGNFKYAFALSILDRSQRTAGEFYVYGFHDKTQAINFLDNEDNHLFETRLSGFLIKLKGSDHEEKQNTDQ